MMKFTGGKDYVRLSAPRPDGSEHIQLTEAGAKRLGRLQHHFALPVTPVTALQLFKLTIYCWAVQYSSLKHAEGYLRSWRLPYSAPRRFAAGDLDGLRVAHAGIDIARIAAIDTSEYRAPTEDEYREEGYRRRKTLAPKRPSLKPDGIRNVFSQSPFPPELMVDFSQATRLSKDRLPANGSNDDPVVYTGELEAQLRRMAAQFGFDRIPFTYGEFNAFVEYCQDLNFACAHEVAWDPRFQDIAREATLAVASRYRAWTVEPLKLYFAGNLEGLRAHHRQVDMLTFLGTTWDEFEEEKAEG